MENYKVERTHEGIKINGILINEEIFQEEKVDYKPIYREEQIDDLYVWIGEATGSDRTNDLYGMKEDLKYLGSLEDEIIFSSISTNEFICKSDNLEGFNAICKEILEINKILGM